MICRLPQKQKSIPERKGKEAGRTCRQLELTINQRNSKRECSRGLPTEAVEFLVTGIAEAPKLVCVVHVEPEPLVLDMVDDKPVPVSTDLAPPAGVALHLLGHEVPVPRAQIILVGHLLDGRGDPFLVGPARIFPHPVESEPLARPSGDQVLLLELFCLVFHCRSHHNDRFSSRPALTGRPYPYCPHDDDGGECGFGCR